VTCERVEFQPRVENENLYYVARMSEWRCDHGVIRVGPRTRIDEFFEVSHMKSTWFNDLSFFQFKYLYCIVSFSSFLSLQHTRCNLSFKHSTLSKAAQIRP